MKRNKFFIVLICVFFIYSIFGFTFIKNDQGFPTIDAPNHALFCLNFSQNAKEIINNSSFSLIDKAKAFKEILSNGIVYWPKFVYLTTLPFIWLFGATVLAIKSTNIIYLFIIMIFGYLLSLQLGAKKNDALIISIAIPLYPLILGAVESYGLDLPLTSFVILFFYILLKTKNFKNSFFSMLAGLILGVGFITKGQIAIFVFFPLVFYFTESLKIKIREEDELINIFNLFANLSLIAIISYIIASLWWRDMFIQMLDSLKEHTIYKSKHLESYPLEKYGSFNYYFFYFKYIFLNGFGPLVSVISIAAVLNFFLRYKSVKKMFLFIWITVPFIVFSVFFQVKQLRFIMPLAPPIAIATVLGLGFKGNYKSVILKLIFLCSLIFQLLVPLLDIRVDSFLQWFSTPSLREIFFKREISANAVLAEKFMSISERYMDDKKKNVIIFRFLPVEDGPVGLQFWIELKGYQSGKILQTHDFFDQWLSVYNMLKEKDRNIIFFIGLKDTYGKSKKEFWNKDEIFKTGEYILPWFEEFSKDSFVVEILDIIFPVLKKNSEKIGSFDYNNYYCEIYSYENVSEPN